MARKKKASRKHHARRRRVSGMGAIGANVTSALYVVAGAAAAGYVYGMLPATLTNEKVKAAIPLAAGILLPKFVKGNVVSGLATGMVALGGYKLLQSFGISGLAGAGADYSVPSIAAVYNRNGLVDNSTFGTPAIAGMDELGC